VTKFEYFYAATFSFLWYVLFEYLPSFKEYNNFANSQIFRRIVKFGKCAIQNFIRVSNHP